MWIMSSLIFVSWINFQFIQGTIYGILIFISPSLSKQCKMCLWKQIQLWTQRSFFKGINHNLLCISKNEKENGNFYRPRKSVFDTLGYISQIYALINIYPGTHTHLPNTLRKHAWIYMCICTHLCDYLGNLIWPNPT